MIPCVGLTWRDVVASLWLTLCDAVGRRRAPAPPPDPLDPGGPDGTREGPHGGAASRHCPTCTCDLYESD